jgi:hypothetical protein
MRSQYLRSLLVLVLGERELVTGMGNCYASSHEEFEHTVESPKAKARRGRRLLSEAVQDFLYSSSLFLSV